MTKYVTLTQKHYNINLYQIDDRIETCGGQ